MNTAGPFPLIPDGETALDHARRLVRQGTTDGALVLPQAIAEVCRSADLRVVVQRYPRESDHLTRLMNLAERIGCTFQVLVGVTGVVANYLVDGGEEAWPPEGDAEEVVRANGDRVRIETPDAVLFVVESADPEQLARFYEEWKDPWIVPVVLVTGDCEWPDGGSAPGVAAGANFAQDASGMCFVTYSLTRERFEWYHQLPIRVNPELAQFLPG